MSKGQGEVKYNRIYVLMNGVVCAVHWCFIYMKLEASGEFRTESHYRGATNHSIQS
jgi:hypothetical protein